MTAPSANSRPFYYRLALVLFSMLAIGYISIIGKEILCPLLFGLLLSILLLPLANFFEKKLKLKRSGAAALSVLLVVLSVAGIIMLVGSQLSGVSDDFPLLKEQVISSMHEFQRWITTRFHVNTAKQMTYLNAATEKIQSLTPSVISATVLSLSSIMLFVVFIMLDTFFLLLYRRLLLNFLLESFKEHNASIVHDIVENVQSIIRKYIIGLFLQMVTVAVICCTIFLLLGLKYAVLLGLITAMFNIVPYIGIFAALLLNVIITFATTGLASKVLLVLFTVVIVHLIDSNILLPVIVGSKVSINAFITLTGVIAGEMIWGIPGMFLSIPVIAISKIIFDRVAQLQPWGNLLGEDKEQQEEIKKDKNRLRFFKKFRTRKTSAITVTEQKNMAADNLTA